VKIKMIRRLIKKLKTYKGEKINRNKKIEINNLESLEFIEYLDECIFKLIALSTNEKAIQFRIKNPQIDFHKCRFNCPMYEQDGFCNSYSSMIKLNPVMLVEF